MIQSAPITLRDVATSDRPIFFEQQLDPEANWMAAFVSGDPLDRAAFDARWPRVLPLAGVVNKTILRGGEIVGEDRGFAAGRGQPTAEYLCRLDA